MSIPRPTKPCHSHLSKRSPSLIPSQLHLTLKKEEDSSSVPTQAPTLANSLNPPAFDNSWPAWSRCPTKEPLSHHMKDSVRIKLKDYYRWCREQYFREEMEGCWRIPPWILQIDSSSSPLLSPAQLKRLCNKSTVFYWMRAAQTNTGHCRNIIGACVYKQWFRYYHGLPNIEQHHFFACPVRISSTGPTTIAGVVQAHESLCGQAISLLEKIALGETRPLWRRPWPDPNHYKFFPLCRALIIILNDYEMSEDDEEPDGIISLDKLSHRLKVLMVRTGDESGLSAPISFESIRSKGASLHTDTANTNVDVTEVSLATAIAFVVQLEQRELKAFPYLEPRFTRPQGHYREPESYYFGRYTHHLTADEYADRLMQLAEERGIDNVDETRDAVRRAEADQTGKYFQQLEPKPELFNCGWR